MTNLLPPRFLAAFAVACIALWSGQARAEAPRAIPVQGFLVDNAGDPVDGEVDLKLALYTSDVASAAIYNESQTIMVDAGYFTVYMGAMVALDLSLFSTGNSIFLGMTVGTDSEMTPRFEFGSVPFAAYAQFAGDATTLSGLSATDLAPAEHTHSFADIADLPSGLSDGDDNTTYTAGAGLSLIGTTFVADTTALQTRVTGACQTGEVLTGVNIDGSVDCATDSDLDPIFLASAAAEINASNISNWETAYGWGDHGAAGYLKSETDPVFAASEAANFSTGDKAKLDSAATTTLLAYGRTPTAPGRSCLDIKTVAPWSLDGTYLIDPDGMGPINLLRVRCDMTRDGGGWTLAVKNRYGSGVAPRSGGFGSVDDFNDRDSDFYKLDDASINAIIGDGTFDILADQTGHNSAWSSGNHEFIVVRNYTATFTFAALVPDSSTETVFESYRSSDNLLVWRGRLGCGIGGGVGINCLTVLSTPAPVGSPNPAGGSGCLVAMGTSTSPSWHHFYMGETNTDSYIYICNGAQHSSSANLSHRWWFR